MDICMIIFDHIVCIHLGEKEEFCDIYINQCVPYTTHTRILNIMLKKRDLDVKKICYTFIVLLMDL